ncbi:MAG: hypothetical protein ACI9G1_002809, partial [Pirellulaceae bacterium]
MFPLTIVVCLGCYLWHRITAGRDNAALFNAVLVCGVNCCIYVVWELALKIINSVPS